MSFNSLGSIAALLVPFFSIGPMTFAPPHSLLIAPNASNEWSVVSTDASSTGTEVTIDINGLATTTVVHAPYGVRTSLVSTYQNGQERTQASTTPMTQADVQAMEQRQIDLEEQMNQLFAQQQKLFNEMWRGM